MTSDSGFDFLRFRDGTSQQQRNAKALNPDYFQIDERSLKDLLTFARKYAETLSFYNNNNEKSGDWSAFLEGDLNEMVAYLKNPSFFDHQPDKVARYSKPHFALFLTFLSLLAQAQEQMNKITQRQLDFYYQQALELQPQSGRADQVHLLAALEPKVDQLLVPKGTLLVAGEDEEGTPIFYQTDEDLLANQAQIAQMKSLFVDKDLSIPARIREENNQAGESQKDASSGDLIEDDSVKSVFLKILKLVYRKPDTENTPRKYPHNKETDRELGFDVINELDALFKFIQNNLHLRITTFEHIVELFRAWGNPLNWNRPNRKKGGINDYLIKAGRKASQITDDHFSFDDPYDFEENIKTALGVAIDGQTGSSNIFTELKDEGVNNIYQLYSAYLRLKNSNSFLGHKIVDVIIDDLHLGEHLAVVDDKFIKNGNMLNNFEFEKTGKDVQISTQLEEKLDGEKSIRIPSTGDNFLTIKYTGNKLMPSLKIIRDVSNDISNITFAESDDGKLTITIPKNPSLENFESMMQLRMETFGYLKEIIRVLSNAQQQNGKTPGTASYLDYEKGKTLSNLFKRIASPPRPIPELSLPESAKDLIVVTIPGATISSNALRDAWIDKSGFSLDFKIPFEVPVFAPFTQIIDMIFDGRSKIVNGQEDEEDTKYESIDFSKELPSDLKGNSLRITYKYQRPVEISSKTSPIRKPQIIISKDKTPSISVNFDKLILKIPTNTNALSIDKILKLWKEFHLDFRRGFKIEPVYAEFDFTPDLDDPILLTKETPSKEFTHQISNSDGSKALNIRYAGLSDIPKVKFQTGVGAINNESKSTLAKDFSDDYFKIIAGQLHIAETYFKMSAEDYFFIRNLYEKPEDGNWKYKDPAWKWRKADELFEKAHRSILGQTAAPQISRWKNLFIAQDATQVLVSGFQEEELPRWKTFGKVPHLDIPEDKTIIEVGELGFIFCSSALSLDEGKRTLALTLTFEQDSFNKSNLTVLLNKLEQNPEDEDSTDDEKYPFRIEVSTEKEWVILNKKNRKGFEIGTNTLKITLELTEEIPPLSPLAEGYFQSPFPALKLSLEREELISKDETQHRRPYEFLKNLLLTNVKLDIKVEGIKNIQLQNKQGILDAKSPFEPFGFQPQVGDRFYITHPEIAAQRMDSLKLNLKWKNFPEGGLFPHYQLYRHFGRDLGIPPEINDETFGVQITLREAHRSLNFNPDSSEPKNPLRHNLFSSISEQVQVLEAPEIEVPNSERSFNPYNTPYLQNPNPKFSKDVREADRYLEIELLSPDFQHNRFPALLTTQGLFGDKVVILKETFLKKEIINGNTIQLRGNLLPSHGIEDFRVVTSGGIIEVTDFKREDKKLTVIGDDGQLVEVFYPGGTSTILNEGDLIISDNEITLSEELSPNLTIDDFKVFKVDSIFTISEFKFIKKQLILHNDPANDLTVFYIYTGTVIIPEPFTPELESISVDYTTSVEVVLPSKDDRSRSLEDPLPLDAAAEEDLGMLYHLHPFGISDILKNGAWIRIAENKETKEVIEKFRYHFLPKYEDEGQLYLGIENLYPPQTLALLFQQAEGSGNPDFSIPKIEWAFLADDKWEKIGSERIRKDTTAGLQKTGIVELAIPAEASLKHNLMPSGLHWIRISVNRHSIALNNTIAIHTQPIKATRFLDRSGTINLGQALSPNSISKPSQPIPGLLNFAQPYTTFNGKSKEQTSSYYRRVSERLRHKNRALTLWDYERLVLEQFPDIYKAKALSSDLLDADALPGSVTVLVIPDIRFRRPFDPFEPKVPQAQLANIQNFLQQVSPPFAQVKVQNPKFDYLHVRTSVKFHDMDNFDFYADQLQQELKKYLSPWAFDNSSEITFGSDIYLSVIVHFIENRPYVDYIDQPKLFLMERRVFEDTIIRIAGTTSIGTDGNIKLRGPDIILVTAPEHTIDYLDDSIPPGERVLSGIGYAKLHLDFDVQSDTLELNS